MTRTLVILLVALPVLVVLLFWGLQRRLIYFPLGSPGTPASAGLPRAEEVRFATGDGLLLKGWFLPAAGGKAVAAVLVCNGNGGHRGMRADLAAGLASRGMSVLLFDYRGYGGNPGRPTENGLYRDARAARDYLDSRDDVDPDRVLYLGESLGAAVCLALAVERPPLGLVLRSPFTSLVDVAAYHYPFLPVRWMLRERYPSVERAPQLTCPVEVIAGARDRIVPPEQSRRLAEVLDGRGRLTVVPGAGHNDPVLAAGSRGPAEKSDAVRRWVLRGESKARQGVDASAHRRRGATRESPATPSGPSGCGGMGPSSSFPLLPDATTSPSSRRLESEPMASATDGIRLLGRTSSVLEAAAGLARAAPAPAATRPADPARGRRG